MRRDQLHSRANYTSGKGGETYCPTSSNHILKNLKLEESSENEPLGLTKKRLYLSELKQSILGFKDSNVVLQSDSHILSIYLKKS